MLTLVHRHCDNDSHRQVSNLCHYSSDVTLWFKWMFRWFSSHLHVLRPSFHAHVSFAVIGCGWLQALRVAGVHLITAKRGGQAHPPQTSPLNIFMYQVGLLISSSPYSQSQIFFFFCCFLVGGEDFISHYPLMQITLRGHFKFTSGNERVCKCDCRVIFLYCT